MSNVLYTLFNTLSRSVFPEMHVIATTSTLDLEDRSINKAIASSGPPSVSTITLNFEFHFISLRTNDKLQNKKLVYHEKFTIEDTSLPIKIKNIGINLQIKLTS